MLYYLPLEPYVERYTYMMSSVNGWAEHHFKNNNVPFVRIDGDILSDSINCGVVLDACGRSYYAQSQINKVIKLLNDKKITENDTIYVEDFWHPGIESLFYIRHLTKTNFKIGTFLHAQSVDDTDFAYNMKDWMRPIEIGYGRQYDYIFVTSAILKNLCIKAGIGTEESIHNIGLPYNSTRLVEQLAERGINVQQEISKKENYVLFSSRFDDEKDPMFFLDLVESCPDINFKLVNPRKTITSNKEVLKRLSKVVENCPNFELVDTKIKENYYKTLAHAKVQFNCAHQDWVSWTLLEAITFKCIPLYPIWKDFPVELHNDPKYLYIKRDLEDCKKKLYNLMDSDFDESLNYIVQKHDDSWPNYLKTMNLI